MDEEHLSKEIMLSDFNDFRGDTVGQMVFNGGIYNFDNSVFDKKMDEVYVDDFKPFLANLKIDEVDMYIYLRQELEDAFRICEDDHRIKQKGNILAWWCSGEIDEFVEDFQTANEDDGWIALQALWRGHGCRWKYPCFTFKE